MENKKQMENTNLQNLMTFDDFITILKQKGVKTSKYTLVYAAQNSYLDYVLINPQGKHNTKNMLLLKSEKNMSWKPKQNYNHNNSNYQNILVEKFIDNAKLVLLKDCRTLDLEKLGYKIAQSKTTKYFIIFKDDVRVKNIFANKVEKIILQNGEEHIFKTDTKAQTP